MKAITLRDYKQRLLPVLVHIQQRLDEPLRLDDLARLAHFSPYHFHRVFRGMIGESLQSHVRRLRLERAAGRLKQGDLSVVQIAFEAGYETHEAFTRAFKASFGLAPSVFRSSRQPALNSTSHRAPSGVHYREGQSLKHFRTMRNPDPKRTVVVKTLPPQRVAFVRHIGPYADCGKAWDTLCAFLGKEGLLGADNRFIGLSYDDPEVTPPDKIRYDACVTVDDTFHPSGEIGVQVIAGGDYAVMTHYGPYERLNDTYALIMGQWLPRSGRVLGDPPSFEVYLTDPNSTAPADLMTEVHIPLNS